MYMYICESACHMQLMCLDYIIVMQCVMYINRCQWLVSGLHHSDVMVFYACTNHAVLVSKFRCSDTCFASNDCVDTTNCVCVCVRERKRKRDIDR